MDAALGLAGVRSGPASALTKAALLRNLDIAERLPCMEGMAAFPTKRILAKRGSFLARICDGWPGFSSPACAAGGFSFFTPPAPPAARSLAFTGCRQRAKHTP